MYESVYGFRERPFSLLPDPAFLFLAKQHSNALAMLEYGLTCQAGFTVITGDVGCGKTTLIRHLLNCVERDVTVGLLSNTHRAIGELLQWVLLAFGLDYQQKGKVALYETFFNFIIGEYAKNRRTVLIIDEAQNLGVDTLEELRMLSNVNADKDQVLQLILVGQPELRLVLRGPDLTQFAQRVSVDYYLPPFEPEQTRDYIAHRLGCAGGDPSLFEPEACEVIHFFARGVPRLINTLCDTSLVYGYAERADRIGAAIVRAVLQDKGDSILFATGKAPESVVQDVRVIEKERPISVPVEHEDPLHRDVYRDLFSSLQVKS